MIQDSRPASRLALAWAVLLPLVLTGACKEAPKAQPGSAAPKPGAGQAEKAPVPARGPLVFLAGQQGKDQRQPGQKQIPDQKCVEDVARP